MQHFTPCTQEEVARVVVDALKNRRAMRVEGTGSKSPAFSQGDDDLLSTSGLSGIVAYNPAELVMTAKAGTSMAEIEAALAENNQMLAFEPAKGLRSVGTQCVFPRRR
ncbi:MAG: FAD-binding protein [Pseudomonadota bacterium]